MNQLTLFNLQEFESGLCKPVYDSYWDEVEEQSSNAILEQSSGHIPSPAPPHFSVGEQIFCDAVENPGKGVGAQVSYFAEIGISEISVGAQVSYFAEIGISEISVGAQVTLGTQKFAPQHEKPVHWVERYWVNRSGNKYWYFRYRWMSGRKSHRAYLGSVQSRLAQSKVEMVREAIAAGSSPSEIREMISASRQ